MLECAVLALPTLLSVKVRGGKMYKTSWCSPGFGVHSPQGYLVAGSASFLLLCAALVAYLLFKGRRDNSAAPKDASKPFCVVFTDIQSSTHLWATIPSQMATD
jgi:hypothetical protein